MFSSLKVSEYRIALVLIAHEVRDGAKLHRPEFRQFSSGTTNFFLTMTSITRFQFRQTRMHDAKSETDKKLKVFAKNL